MWSHTIEFKSVCDFIIEYSRSSGVKESQIRKCDGINSEEFLILCFKSIELNELVDPKFE